MALTLRVNGSPVFSDSDQTARLSRILRDDLGLTGLKEGCLEGECGACTVLVDDLPVHACMVLGFQAQGHDITTVEGLCESGAPTPLQTSFVEEGAVQCGYCTPGMVMSAEGLLRANSTPGIQEIRHALAGNICRCTGFEGIVRAIAAEVERRKGVRA